MSETTSRRYIRTGAVGAAIATLCCFTPLLVLLLSVVGLGAVTGYLDYLLLSVLALCLAMLAYGVYLHRKGPAGCPPKANHKEPQ